MARGGLAAGAASHYGLPEPSSGNLGLAVDERCTRGRVSPVRIVSGRRDSSVCTLPRRLRASVQPLPALPQLCQPWHTVLWQARRVPQHLRNGCAGA